MKIVIIGGGISGCTAYLQLKKHLPGDHAITIYEAYDTNVDTTADDRVAAGADTHSSTLIVGGGLGVGGNGQAVLQRLDEDMLRDVVRNGYTCDTMHMKGKNGKVLASIRPGSVVKTGLMNIVACSRHELWRTIRLRVPSGDIVKKRVSRVVAHSEKRNVVHFADGTHVEADLVIGADGLHSVAKLALFDNPDKDPYPPHYEGLCGVGGFIPYDTVKGAIDAGSMNMVTGGNGFFGYFVASSAVDAPHRESPHHVSPPGDSVAWWSTYAVTPCPDSKSLDADAVTRDLHERHSGWKDPVIQAVLRQLSVQSMYPTWTVPSLPTWARDGVVLIGDAAHALPPTSGQGCSQALEDTECFAMFLAHAMKQGDGKEAVVFAAKQFQELRAPRVGAILDAARRWQDNKRDKALWKEYLLYAGMWLMGFFPGVITKPMAHMFEYNIAHEVNKVLGVREDST